MGDVLRTTCVLPVLKRAYPASHITWITKSNSVGLLVGNPYIDRVLSVDSNYLETILVEAFDLAIGPDSDVLSASIMTLIRSSVKRGFVSDGRGGVLPLNKAAENWWLLGLDDEAKSQNRRTYGQWVYDMCELAEPIERPVFVLSADLSDHVGSMLQERAPWAHRWICFNTGASDRWREKRWKFAHYLDLATLISDREPTTAIALVGGPEEAELNRNLLAANGRFIDAGTGWSLEHFAAVIAKSDYLLTPDSLGYHIGCAVGTPTVCLVGPTSPWELDLYETNRVLHTDIDCISCYRQECPFEVTCMTMLTSRRVLEHLPNHGIVGKNTSGVYALSSCSARGERVQRSLVQLPG